MFWSHKHENRNQCKERENKTTERKSTSQRVHSKSGSLQNAHSIPKSCTLAVVRVPSDTDKRSAWPSPTEHIVEADE